MSELERVVPMHATQVHGVPGPVTGPAEPVVEAPEAEAAPKLAKAKPRWGHRVAWVLAMMAVGVAVGGLIVAFLKFVDGKVDGTVMAGPTLKSAQAGVTTKTPEPNLLGGLTVEFSYPSNFDTVGQVRTDTNAIEQYNISSKQDYSRMIAVNVRNLPSRSLADDSSYRVRQINKDEYKETNDVMGADPIALMTKSDRTEQTLFWVHGGREFRVSVTTNNVSKDDVTATVKLIRQTLRWKK